MKKFFTFLQNPNFDVASDAQATFKVSSTDLKQVYSQYSFSNSILRYRYNLLFSFVFYMKVWERTIYFPEPLLTVHIRLMLCFFFFSSSFDTNTTSMNSDPTKIYTGAFNKA